MLRLKLVDGSELCETQLSRQRRSRTEIQISSILASTKKQRVLLLSCENPISQLATRVKWRFLMRLLWVSINKSEKKGELCEQVTTARSEMEISRLNAELTA